jgi:hypothetical protein
MLVGPNDGRLRFQHGKTYAARVHIKLINLRRPALSLVAVICPVAALVACSSSSPPPPDQAKLLQRLEQDSSLRGALLLVSTSQRTSVLSCTATHLRSDAKAADLASYVAGKRTFAAISKRGSRPAPSADLQTCVRSSLTP